MTTYSELVTQIIDYTETDSNVLTTTIVNDFIEHAELRLYRELDIDPFRNNATATLTSRRSSLSNSSVGSTTPLVNVVLTDARRPPLAWNGSGVWKDVTTENGEA